MSQAVVVDCIRTPIGRADPKHGFYRRRRGDDLLASCFAALVARTRLDPQRLDDVVVGCAKQTREQGLNVARVVALLAGLPASCAAVTVNRLCGSSLQALHQAAHAIQAGSEDIQLVGGLEHMHHLPIGTEVDVNPRLFRHTSKAALDMTWTAEFLAGKMGIGRVDQDAFAYLSHCRAAAARASGELDAEILAQPAHDPAGQPLRVDFDQCVREQTSLEALARLPTLFPHASATLTAGNCAPLNDGAAALLVMSERTARKLGLRPLVRVRSTAVAGVDPCMMGTGPVAATKKALARAHVSLADVGLIELNEAFAVQALACQRLLDLDVQRMNVRGGALALGHPLGASGARMATTLIRTMLAREVPLGLATMCIGMGQGIATVFELVER